MRHLFPLVCLAAMSLSPVLSAQEELVPIPPEDPKLDRPVDFERDVYPILDASCVACHNVVVDEGDLIVEEIASILKGGGRGPAVVPGKPDESLLIQFAGHLKQPIMPPLPNDVEAAKLTPKQLGILRQWVLEGAKQGSKMTKAAIVWQPVPDTIQSSYSVALSPHSRYAAVSRANRIAIYDLATQEQVAQLSDPLLAEFQQEGKSIYASDAAHQDFVHSLAFHPSETMLASGGYRVAKLWKRSDEVRHWAHGLSGEITALAVDPENQRAALGTSDHKIVIVSLADGQTVREWAGHEAAVTGIGFSPDGTKLFTGSLDKKLIGWNVADGTPAGEIETGTEIHSVCLNKDGTRIFSGHQDNVIRGWELPGTAQPAEGETEIKPVVELKGHGQPPAALLPHPGDANQVVSGSTDGTARLWKIDNGQNLRSINHGAAVNAVAISADGSLLLTAGADGVARVWDANNGQKKVEVKGDVLLSRSAVERDEAFSVAKQRVTVADAAVKAEEKAVTERTESLKKANEALAAADKALQEVQEKVKPLQAAYDQAKQAFDDKNDDKDLEKAFKDAETALNKENENLKKAEEAQKVASNSVKLSEQSLMRSEQSLAEAKQTHEQEQAKQAEAEAAQQAATEAANASVKPLTAAAFSPDGKSFAAAGEDGSWNRWATENGNGMDRFGSHEGAVTGMIWASPQTLLTVGGDKQAVSWNPSPAWELARRYGPPADRPLETGDSECVDRVLALAFSRNGEWLATGGGEPSRSGELILWKTESGEIVRKFEEPHSDTVLGIEFSYDNQFLLSGAADKFAKLFSVESGKFVRSYEGHTHHVMDVALKADGSELATAGADNAIKIWNLETGEQKRTIAGYSKQVTSIQYMGDTDQIVSCGGDKTVRFHRSGNGQNFRSFSGATDFMYATAASRDLTVVIAAGEDGVLRVWNGTNGQSIVTFTPEVPDTKQVSARP
jgi:WD40 repeat protein